MIPPGWLSVSHRFSPKTKEPPSPGHPQSRGILPLGCLYHLRRPGLADTDSLSELGKAQPTRFLYADRELETDRPRRDSGVPQRLHEPARLSERGFFTPGRSEER